MGLLYLLYQEGGGQYWAACCRNTSVEMHLSLCTNGTGKANWQGIRGNTSLDLTKVECPTVGKKSEDDEHCPETSHVK